MPSMRTMTLSNARYAHCDSGMPSFVDLLSRADESVLQELIGIDAVRLIQKLDSSLAVPSALRELIITSTRPEEILRARERRGALFDLMTVEEATGLQQDLGLKGPDPYAALKSAQFRKDSIRESVLFGRLGVHVEDPLQEAEDSADEPVEAVTPSYPLFHHQRRAIRETWELFQRAKDPRVLLHMPTGAGKTRSAMHVVARYLIENEGHIVIWLANTEELCSQAADEFRSSWQSLGNRPMEIYRFWSSHEPNLEDMSDGILICGLSKLYALAQKDVGRLLHIADKTGLVVFDEAHQVLAPTYSLLLGLFIERNPETWLLGLSATPGRTWNDVEKDAELAHFFRRQKIMLHVEGYENPIDFLVDRGFLANPHFRDLFYDGGVLPTEADIAAIEQGLDVPKQFLDRLGKDDQRNLLIITSAEVLAKQHSRMLVFAPNVRSADAIAAALRARGWWAVSITGATPGSRRSRALEEYKGADHEARILVNFGVLTTGFDAPGTSAAIIARPTLSLVLYSQMVGRALRGPSVGGNSDAEIVSIVDTSLPGFRAPSEMFQNWEDVW